MAVGGYDLRGYDLPKPLAEVHRSVTSELMLL